MFERIQSSIKTWAANIKQWIILILGFFSPLWFWSAKWIQKMWVGIIKWLNKVADILWEWAKWTANWLVLRLKEIQSIVKVCVFEMERLVGFSVGHLKA